MRIVHVYKDYFPVEGGIENHLKSLAEAQAARGHEVSVLVTSRDRRTHIENLNGVRVIFAARLATVSSTPISLAMWERLSRERPDIAHLQFPYPWGELAQYCLGRARRTVLTYQSDIVRQRYLRVVYAPLMHRVLAQVDKIIATSPNYIASSAVLARWKDKCVAVPMAIDPLPFLNVDAEAARKTRQQLSGGGVSDNTPLLLFTGVLRYYKGLQYLLEALPSIPDVRLAVVGSGPMEREWKERAHTLGIADRVKFVGEVANPQLPPFYAACDIFVLPSCERSEAFGLVQLEAMAAGRPTIATEVGTGTSFVTQHEVNGLIVPARDPVALAAAITRLIRDQDLRARMGAAGRERVLRHFTFETMIQQIEAVYQAVLGV